MLSDREVRGLLREVNWRTHLVGLTALMASCLLFGITVALFHAEVTTMTAWEIGLEDGPLIFNCVWILVLCVVALRRCFRMTAQAEWLIGMKFKLSKQYKLKIRPLTCGKR
ncbi:MAG: hypothetical protein WBK28_02650 [Minisyncoccia bacterium]